jgi:pilus assembly protein Flp/PilA
MLRCLPRSLIAFLKDEDGPTSVEYALMLALIVIVCFAAVTTLGSNSKTTYTTVATKISAS